jgi:hypothetical protein
MYELHYSILLLREGHFSSGEYDDDFDDDDDDDDDDASR